MPPQPTGHNAGTQSTKYISVSATLTYNERRGLVLGLIGVIIFGLTLPATRLAVVELDPVFVGLGRAVVAAVPAAIVLLLARAPIPSRRQFALIAVTAAGIVLGFPLLATIAMRYAPAAHGGVILAMLPLTTAMAGAVVAGERPSTGFWLTGVAGAIAVASYAFLSTQTTGTADDNASSMQWADLMLVGAVISAAMGYAIGGQLSRDLGGWQVICWALVISAPVMLAIVALLSGPINWSASPRAWCGFAYVAAFSMFLGFFFWNQGLALGGIAKVGQLQLLQPFVTLLAAAQILSETIGMLEIGFAALVVALVALGVNMRVMRSSSAGRKEAP